MRRRVRRALISTLRGAATSCGESERSGNGAAERAHIEVHPMWRSRPSPRSHPPPSCRFLAPKAALNAPRDEVSELPLLYGLNRSWAGYLVGCLAFLGRLPRLVSAHAVTRPSSEDLALAQMQRRRQYTAIQQYKSVRLPSSDARQFATMARCAVSWRPCSPRRLLPRCRACRGQCRERTECRRIPRRPFRQRANTRQGRRGLSVRPRHPS